MRTDQPSAPPVAQADPERVRAARLLAESAPVPARTGTIVFGTAGWTDPTLIRAGTFYPSVSLTPTERLAHYAKHFSMVEVDATFYAIPAPSVSLNWVERTPDGFLFDIKAHPVLTGHPIDRTRLGAEFAELLHGVASDKQRLYPKDLPGELREALVRRFREFVEPLRQARKLGCVMVQLPPWTTSTRGAVRELENLRLLLPELLLAIEFRHPSWLAEGRRARVFDMLRAAGFAYVVVDEPDVVGGGVPAVVRATRDDLGIVRFHGHNVAGWRKGATVTERFNYLYSPEELAAWVKPIRTLSGETGEVHAVFNNCVRDYAVLGAKDLAALVANENRHGGVAASARSC